MRGIAKGEEHKQIARELGLSYQTVKTYIPQIRIKMGALNITHAVARAAQRGLI